MRFYVLQFCSKRVKRGITMSRVQGVKDNEAGIRVRLIFNRIKRRLGSIPLSARIRAHDLELLRVSEKMSAHNTRSVTVAPKLKELAQLKVAAMVGCPL
jgi:hypothetical protein